MRMLGLGLSLVLVCAVFARGVGAGSDEDIAEIKKAKEQYVEAVKKADVKTMEAILAPDIRIITTGGVSWGRAKTIDLVRTGNLRVKSSKQKNVEFRKYGSVVVETGRTHDIGTFLTREEFNDDAYYTTVWVKNMGRWQMVSVHCSVARE